MREKSSDERIGLLLVGCALLAVFMASALFLRAERDARIERNRDQGASLARLLSSLSHERLLPEDGSFLMDVPVLGYLARRTEHVDLNTETVVILRAHISGAKTRALGAAMRDYTETMGSELSERRRQRGWTEDAPADLTPDASPSTEEP